ncbi:hypothetical protein [Bartonella sp. CB178]|uniref:hypothetical protein n=1 Tax=Bartonella sp. CB178 TaxID=3112255 RepID=UPI00300DC8FD
MEFFWRRMGLIAVVCLVFVSSLLASKVGLFHKFTFTKSLSSYRSEGVGSGEVDLTESVILERLVVSFPDILAGLSQLDSRQKEWVVEFMRKNAVAAAFADGWGDESARKFGEAVAIAIAKAASRPTVGDDYF